MTIQAGFIIEGDDEANYLRANAVKSGGDTKIYNIIYGHGGDDTLIGNDGLVDTRLEKTGVQLFGEDGNDTLRGTDGADTLSGGAGDDTITYDDGRDLIDGGEGEDTLIIYTPYVKIDFDKLTPTGIEKIETGGATLHFGAWNISSFDEISGGGKLAFSQKTTLDGSNLVGAFDFAGSSYDDVFDLSKSSFGFDAHGGGGNDIVTAGGRPVQFWGDDGNDTLVGGAGYDQLHGDDGDDELVGGGDRGDSFEGGAGNDTLTGGVGKDDISAGAGNDNIDAGAGNDNIYVGAGDDVVHAGDGNDLVSGARLQFGAGAAQSTDYKVIDGGAGNDVFEDFKISSQSKSRFLGGDGEDKIVLGGDASHLVVRDIEILQIYGGRIIADADVLDSFDHFIGIKGANLAMQFSSGGNFTWDASSEKPVGGTLSGSKEADHIDMSAATQYWTIDGGKGDDSIVGPSSSNFIQYLNGGDGNDTLTGGKFDDDLHGGQGNDVLIATKGDDGLYGEDGKDTFIFGNQIGSTTIVNYDNVGRDRDVIDLSAVSAIKDFNDMIDHHIEMTGEGHWLTIHFGKGQINLYGVTSNDLDESAFVF